MRRSLLPEITGFVAAKSTGRYLRFKPTTLSAYTDRLSEARFWKTEGGVERFLFAHADLHKIPVRAQLDSYSGKVVVIKEEDNDDDSEG